MDTLPCWHCYDNARVVFAHLAYVLPMPSCFSSGNSRIKFTAALNHPHMDAHCLIADGQQLPRKVETQSLDKMAEVKADIEKQQMVAALKKADGKVATTEKKSSAVASTAGGDTCHTQPNTELWGDVVVSGSMLKKDSAGECCEACKAVKPKSEDDLDCNGGRDAPLSRDQQRITAQPPRHVACQDAWCQTMPGVRVTGRKHPV